MISTSTVKTTSTVKGASIAAVWALALAGAALSAHHALAQTARLPGPNLAPGKSVEMIAPAAAITSTAHYQAQLDLTCGSSSCSGSFQKAGASRQLNITRISCFIETTSDATSTFRFGEIELWSGAGAFILRQLLPLDFSYAGSVGFNRGIHTLNRAVDLQLTGGQHVRVFLELATGEAFGSTCTATGTLSTLG